MLYRDLILKLLLYLPPETAQTVAERILRCKAPWILIGKYINQDIPELNTEVCGISLSSPIGLAAGFDKDFRMMRSLSELGFGYITEGTVMLNPQPGHPIPRLIRDVPNRAILNSMGFPSKGLEFVEKAINQEQTENLAPIIASISGIDLESIRLSYERLAPLVSAIEVNISSPNTSGLKIFHDPARLSAMIIMIREIDSRPLFIKLPPHNEETTEINAALSLASACIDSGANGITVSNSHPIEDDRLSVGHGGLSGARLINRTLKMVSRFRSHLGPDIAINACGGIFSGDDVFNALLAGANTTQLYTAFIYRGPAVVKSMKNELLNRMKREGISRLNEINQGYVNY